MDANSNEQAKEALHVVFEALRFFCYFVFSVTVAVAQKLFELGKGYINKQKVENGQSVPVPANALANPNYQSIKFGPSGSPESSAPASIKMPENPNQKAAIRDPQYQTLAGLPDDIFKKKE